MFRTAKRFLVPCLLKLATACSFAATGDLLTAFNFGVSDMVADPTRSLIYATVPSTNSVAVFNSTNLSLVTTIFIGSNPTGLALSPDSSKLYVANSGSTASAIGVLDLTTLTTLPSISAPQQAYDVAVGNGGRLYATSANGVMQFDLGTGTYTTTFPSYGAYSLSYGHLAISADRNRLFQTQQSSPQYLESYDVSTASATVLQQITTQEGGQAIPVVNHSGSAVIMADGYTLESRSTSDITSIYGTYNLGPYTAASAFSPDDKWLYAAHYGFDGVVVFNANTFVSTASFSIADDPTAMEVDNTGRYLFVGEQGHVQVFSTGISAAPEPSVTGLMTAALACAGMTRRGRKIRH